LLTKRLAIPLLLLVLPAALVALGCGSTTPQPVEKIDLVQSTTEVAEDQLLDVAIRVFDTGLPEEGEELPPGVLPEVRSAEARYMAYRLEETMQETGHWGAVRVVPHEASTSDIMVSARILESTGKDFNLHVWAFDATGRQWFENRYKGRADPAAYQPETIGRTQPFQNVYNRIANDLVRALNKLDPGDVTEIRRVSKLDYAVGLAPMAFQDYLEIDRRGRKEVAHLPADNDPMMARVEEIREREYFFIDVLNQHYANFFQQMTEPYDNWRKFSYEEELALAALRRKATTQQILGGLAVLGSMLMGGNSTAERVVRDAALIGGVAAIQAGVATRKEAKIHLQAIEELTASFDDEVEPMVVEVEGRVLRLSGSVETQYETWRQLLSSIWAGETELPTDPNTPPAVNVPH
jgi:hypothetical protein